MMDDYRPVEEPFGPDEPDFEEETQEDQDVGDSENVEGDEKG